MRRVSLLALLTFVLAIWMHVFINHRFVEKEEFSRILYLPPPNVVSLFSFGYDAIASDFIYLWSIQYFTGESSNRGLLPRTYEIITELDPYYLDAYDTGALFLFHEGRNPKAGLALLDRALEKNPEEWFYPVDAGFFCAIELQDPQLASEYFSKASKIPDAPTMVKELLAGMRYRVGDRELAYALWLDIYKTTDRPSLRPAALQHIHDLKVMIDLDHIRRAISAYQAQKGQLPLNLDQLSSGGFLKTLPLDPEEHSYVYAPASGKVEYSGKLYMYRSEP